ncbi:MAG: PorV/PorQ family protein [Elusimicrobia bacterium]|nr:PorV/PorQ family protein [Candidatus Liberimonas magnetica]
MKNYYIVSTIILAFLYGVLIPSGVYASGDGGAPGYILSEGIGARSLGMGRSFTAVSDDVSALFYNPAGLYQLQQKEAQYMYIKLFEDTGYNAIGYVHTNGSPLTLGAAVTQLQSDNFVSRDALNLPGPAFSDTELTMLLGGCYEITDKLGIGTAVKSIDKKMETLHNSAIDCDAGVLYKPMKNLSFGFDLQNLLGASFQQDDKLPLTSRLGTALKLLNGSLTLAADFEESSQTSLRVHSGMEYSFKNLFAVRAGYDVDTVTTGLGARFKDYYFDYALYSNTNLGLSHRMSMGIKFGKEKNELKKISEKQRLANGLKKTIKTCLAKARKFVADENWYNAINEVSKVLELAPNNKEALELKQQAENIKNKKGSKINIAIIDFGTRNVSSADAMVVSDLLRSEMVKRNVFNVLERSNMDMILSEQKFQNSGCTEQACAVTLGKILNVHKVIMGTVSKLLDAYYIVANVVDVETGAITLSEKEKARSADEISSACRKIARKIEAGLLPQQGKAVNQEMFLAENYPVKIKVMKDVPSAIYGLLENYNAAPISVSIENNTEFEARFKIIYRYEPKTQEQISSVNIEPGDIADVNLYPQLPSQVISGIKKQESQLVRVSLYYIDSKGTAIKLRDDFTDYVTLYPYNQFFTSVYTALGNEVPVIETLVAWVTYNDPALNEVLLKASKRGAELKPQVKIVGGQDPRIFLRAADQLDKDFLHQIELIYNTLKEDYKIDYLNNPIVSDTGKLLKTQRVKFPSETLKFKGNCIDLAVLFATILESIEINPVIVLLPNDGHCVVGWEVPGTDKYMYHLLETNNFGQDFYKVLNNGKVWVDKYGLTDKFNSGIDFDKKGIYKQNNDVIIFNIKKIRKFVPPSSCIVE